MSEAGPEGRKIYHICEAEAWPRSEDAGAYSGGPMCHLDGFIHFSTWEQVPATLARFFAGRRDLILLEADTAQLGSALKWERMGEEIFPHYYGVLRVELARNLGPIEIGPDGHHVLPPRPGEDAREGTATDPEPEDPGR